MVKTGSNAHLLCITRVGTTRRTPRLSCAALIKSRLFLPCIGGLENEFQQPVSTIKERLEYMCRIVTFHFTLHSPFQCEPCTVYRAQQLTGDLMTNIVANVVRFLARPDHKTPVFTVAARNNATILPTICSITHIFTKYELSLFARLSEVCMISRISSVYFSLPTAH